MNPKDFFKDAKVGDRAYYFLNSSLYIIEVRGSFNGIKYAAEWRDSERPEYITPASLMSSSSFILPLHLTPEEARDEAIAHEKNIIDKLRRMTFNR